MTASGRAELRLIADQLLADFLHLVEERHHGAPVDGLQLRQAAQAFGASPSMNRLLLQAHQRLLVTAEGELLRQRRADPFQRLLAHPFTDLFSEGLLSRDVLFNYYSFLHLVLGDTRESLSERCEAIVAELKEPDPLAFSWDDLYDDERAKLVLWTVLTRINETFRRFDARRDWFIGLMEHRPQAISLGSNAFLPRHPNDEARSFGVNEFNLMFGALFGPLRHLSGPDLLAFERNFGSAPQRLFGSLLRELEISGAFL
jgi:hypothetical protein